MPAAKSKKPILTKDSRGTPWCRSDLGCCGHLQTYLSWSERVSKILHLEYIVYNFFFFMWCQYGPDAFLSTSCSTIQVVSYRAGWDSVYSRGLSETHAIICD